MDSTIEQASTTQRALSRRPRRSGAVVIPIVESLAKVGVKRPEIAAILGMSGGHSGSLVRALQRAGRNDLIRAIAPPRGSATPAIDPDRIRVIAAAVLAELPDDPPDVIARHRNELLDDPIAPIGRPVRGRGGVVRWVAA